MNREKRRGERREKWKKREKEKREFCR